MCMLALRTSLGHAQYVPQVSWQTVQHCCSRLCKLQTDLTYKPPQFTGTASGANVLMYSHVQAYFADIALPWPATLPWALILVSVAGCKQERVMRQPVPVVCGTVFCCSPVGTATLACVHACCSGVSREATDWGAMHCCLPPPATGAATLASPAAFRARALNTLPATKDCIG